MLNLCQPDATKSCAACCGVYNVPDATRDTLKERLYRRTALFATVPRQVDALAGYAERIRQEEALVPDNPWTYVCEFTGFISTDQRLVGCMLHPAAAGNEGKDLRGLCHYGSMACKLFFCHAWRLLPSFWVQTIVVLLDDWHLYGLVITDVAYIRAAFGLVEAVSGFSVEAATPVRGNAVRALREIFSWKDAWPWGSVSTLRRSSQHLAFPVRPEPMGVEEHLSVLLERLRFTFGEEAVPPGSGAYVRERLQALLRPGGK